MNRYEDEIKKGCLWLSEQAEAGHISHNWEFSVNILYLNMRDARSCLLGQLFTRGSEDEYGYFIATKLFPAGVKGSEMGFDFPTLGYSKLDWEELQAGWISAIMARRANKPRD